MSKSIFTYLIFCIVPTLVWGQDEIHINDEIEPYNIFTVVDSEILDTSSSRFKNAKINVLKYCSENLDFDIDSTANHYSCREYKRINPHATRKERKLIDRENLKYEFFISFKVHENITYHTSFYLDTAMQVHYASIWLFHVNSDQIWNITPWETFFEKIQQFDTGYILPLKNVDIEYSDKHEKFVYIILQKKNEKTIVTKTSEYTGYYDVNKLIVDAENGKILEKTTQGYSYITHASW